MPILWYHKFMKKIILSVFLLVILGLFVAAFLILNRPQATLTAAQKQQALENILGRQVVLKAAPVITGNVLHQGKYVSFLYPKAAKAFILYTNGQPYQYNDLEHFGFDLSDSHTHFFSEVIAYPSAQTLSDYSGVGLRQEDTTTYTQTTVSVDNQQGLEFSKYDMTAGYEKTVFFLLNGKIYTFVFESPDQQAENDLFNLLIPTIKFAD